MTEIEKLAEDLIKKNDAVKKEILDGLDAALLQLHNVVVAFWDGDADTNGVIQLEDNEVIIPAPDNTDAEDIMTITGIHINNKIVWIKRNGDSYDEDFAALDNNVLIALIQALGKMIEYPEHVEIELEKES